MPGQARGVLQPCNKISQPEGVSKSGGRSHRERNNIVAAKRAIPTVPTEGISEATTRPLPTHCESITNSGTP